MYKRQVLTLAGSSAITGVASIGAQIVGWLAVAALITFGPVSYTHLRAHETVLDLVCRLLLEKKKPNDHLEVYRDKIYTWSYHSIS